MQFLDETVCTRRLLPILIVNTAITDDIATVKPISVACTDSVSPSLDLYFCSLGSNSIQGGPKVTVYSCVIIWHQLQRIFDKHISRVS